MHKCIDIVMEIIIVRVLIFPLYIICLKLIKNSLEKMKTKMFEK